MKLKAAFFKFLTNKWVLNIISLIALFNVIGYVVMGNFNALAYFVVLALLAAYFSKNMIIILGIPLILVNLFALKGNMFKEGMENTGDAATKSADQTTDKEKEDKKQYNDTIKKINQQDRKSKQGLAMTPLDHSVTTTDSTNMDSANTDSSNMDTSESFEVGRAKKKGYDIDFASTVEDAYDELNKILGSDGIKRLTDDTQNLMKQQLQLAESMKSMTPIIKGMAPMMEQAKQILGGMGDGKEGLGGIMEMAKKFTNTN